MSKRILAAIGLAAVLSVPSSAQAISSINLVWRTTGTPTITVPAAGGDRIVADVVVSVDSAGLNGFGISFVFDPDGLDELDIDDMRERNPVFFPASSTIWIPFLAGPGILAEQRIESTTSNPGFFGGFDVLPPPGAGPVFSETAILGSVSFLTTANVATDGPDIGIVVAPNGIDGILDVNFDLLDPSLINLGGAIVNVPEPSVGLLLVAGLAALSYRRR